jgi:hypothetical protein
MPDLTIVVIAVVRGHRRGRKHKRKHSCSDKFEIHHNAFSFHQANGVTVVQNDGHGSQCQSSSLVQLRYGAHATTTIKFRFRSGFVCCDDRWIGFGQAGVIGGQRNEIVFNGSRNRATHIALVTTRDSHIRRRDLLPLFLEFLTE